MAGPLGAEWSELGQWRRHVAIPDDIAAAAIEGSVSEWLRRYAAFAASDGVVTDDELATFRRAAACLGAPPSIVEPLSNQLQRAHMLGSVRGGALPIVPVPDLHLPTDEHCHFRAAATRWRVLKASTQPVDGQLIVTNKKIRFAALQHGGETPLSKVIRVGTVWGGRIALEATARSLSGEYSVADSEWAEAVIDTALKIHRRVLLTGTGSAEGRRIPQDVKAAVWQRDRGRCVECGADTYLEFDHIIPWSKGGASTVKNVQLLCRRCNLAKSNRL